MTLLASALVLAGGEVADCSSSTTNLVAATILTTLARGGGINFLSGQKQKQKAAYTAAQASKSFNQLWFHIPEPFRFFVSGNIGNLCFFALERTIHNCLNRMDETHPYIVDHKDSISFFLGYILQMGTQHLLHAILVYGLHTIDTREKYLTTLAGQCSAYFTAMIGSTLLNTVLRKHGFSKDMAFFTTLYVFAIINYFVVGWVVRRAVATAEEHELQVSSSNQRFLNMMHLFRRQMRGGEVLLSGVDDNATSGSLWHSKNQWKNGLRSRIRSEPSSEQHHFLLKL